MNPEAVLSDILLSAAIAEGDVAAPTSLLEHLASQADPVVAVANADGYSAAFEELQKDCPSFWDLLRQTPDISPAGIEQLASIMRWAFQEIRDGAFKDPAVFPAILIVAGLAAPRGVFWTALNAASPPSPGFIKRLEALVRITQVGFGSKVGVSIHEQEAVEAMEAAEQQQDWATIALRWPAFENILCMSGILDHGVQGLGALDPDALLRAVKGVSRFLTAVVIVRALPTADCLALSDNPYVQFAVAHLAGSRGSSATLADDALTKLLVRVAIDQDRWSAWMRAFNRFPSRYPGLQVGLGQALAQAPTAAIDAYVEAVELGGTRDDPGRLAVTEALRAFHAGAPIDQRRHLWTKAFETWESWDFGRDVKDRDLSELGFTSLDYAVVGYALECLGGDGLQAAIDQACAIVAGVDGGWYSDLTAHHQAWRRAVSKLQPIVHARNTTTTGEDWLPGKTFALPFDPEKNPYAAIKSGWRDLNLYYRAAP